MSETAAQVAAWCDEAGLDSPAGKPLRLALITTAQAAVDAKGAAEKVGKEAGQRAGQAAGAEVRSQIAKLALQVSWLKRLAVTGLVVGTAGLTWLAARHVPMATPYGRMTPALAETLRWNDLGALLDACTPQASQGGREVCGFTRGWWLSQPPQPK